MAQGSLPTAEDVRRAAARLASAPAPAQCVLTPLLSSPALDEACEGARVWVKAECLQRGGSFKYRGALHALLRLREAGRDGRGVVAFSSGNHAAALARAGADLGVNVKVVMPDDAPAAKVEAARRAGAHLVFYSRSRGESREELGAEIARVEGRELVKPFDDPEVIAGQGTCGLEIARQLKESFPGGTVPGRVVAVVPASGGGLVAGVSLALREAFGEEGVDVWCAEPRGLDDHARSLAVPGREARLANPDGAEGAKTTLCDALMAPQPGEITWQVNRATLAGGLAVSDDEALDAVGAALAHLKLVLEPGGAAALAAAMGPESRKRMLGSSHAPVAALVVVASGGNIDPAVLALALDRLQRGRSS